MMAQKTILFIKPLFLLLLLILLLGNCYLLKQGSYIISYNSKGKKMDKLLENEDLDPELRETFLLVKKIKTFATEKLGLNEDKNYSTYVALEKDYLVDVVSACKKEAFIGYTWWYPFFGRFPYKGFFKRKDAMKEVKALKKKNLDVLMRKVDAFSTLGFFTDPFYSYMADYSVYSLASLIIHEQTHATIWLKDQVKFNEELATFIGREGALLFIKETFGRESEEYTEGIGIIEDNKRFIGHMKSLYKDLNALYSLDIDDGIKVSVRGYIIREFKKRFGSVYYREYHNQNYKRIASYPFNNAYLMLFITYSEDLSAFYNLYKQEDFDLSSTINLLKQVKEAKGNPKEYITTHLLSE